MATATGAYRSRSPIGGDAETSYGRFAGGGRAQLFVSPNADQPNSLAWLTAGLQARNEINLFPLWKRTLDTGTPYYYKQFVLVTTLAGGVGTGKAFRDEAGAGAKHIDMFVGAGVSDQRGTKKARWLAWSVGIAATRIWDGDRDPAWFVGATGTVALGLEDD